MPAHPAVTSPNRAEWTRPKDVFVKLKAKKKALKARLDQKFRQKQLSSTVLSTGVNKLTPQSSTNPFRVNGSSASKWQRLEQPSSALTDQSADNSLFEILRSGIGDVHCDSLPVSETALGQPREAAITSFSQILKRNEHGQLLAVPAPSPSQQGVFHEEEVELPIDWSIHTHVRVLSKQPFPWSSRLKTVEEASALTAAARCLSDEAAPDSSAVCRLHRLGFLWQHPWLPWLKLFPRLQARNAGARSVFTEPHMQSALRTDWCESLRSLFQLVRSRQCPYFYVLAPAFSCMFRAAGVGGVPETHALLTPTSRGLRDLLKRDDVEFTMPLRSMSSSADKDSASSLSTDQSTDSGFHVDPPAPCTQQQDDADGSDGEDEDEEEEDPERWLESIGIETKSMPGISSTRRKLEQQTPHGVDGTDSSTAFIEGSSVQALLNFLLNSRVCVSTTGPLSGVPPTLLSPVAFQGGTLQPLKRRQGTVQRGHDTLHSLELSGGPVMPHTMHALLALLRDTLAEFSVTLNPIRATSAFNRLQPPGEADADAAAPEASRESTSASTSSAPAAVFSAHGLADCGLQPEWVQAACRAPSLISAGDSASAAVSRLPPRQFSYFNGMFTRSSANAASS